jgi:hypothetical protein
VSRRVISKDPFTGVSTYYHSHGDGSFTIEHTQDVQRNIEFNKAELNSGWNGYVSKDKNMKKVAHIPNVLLIDMMKKGLNPFDKNDHGALARFLNSCDNYHLRTSIGRL